ncbi:MAG: ornithine carbamoyltransferase [Chloroflexi bacterium]|nr:ornithine carbamoyltransferase [Chloroflexota bacterium]
MKGKDFISISDLSAKDLLELIKNARKLKKQPFNTLLSGKILALVFEKPSLRTRVSFDVAMKQTGGYTIYLSDKEVGLGVREPVADVSRVLSRYVNIIVARTFAHQSIIDMAKWSSVPVINALSDYEHPCQALADILTIEEKKGKLEGLHLAYLGDGNNCANSLLLAAVLTGLNVTIASPVGYQINDEILQKAKEYEKKSGSKIIITEDPAAAIKDADVVYTDVWTSMGQEAESVQRKKIFKGYKINNKMLKLAKKDAIVMHPLPAHYGEEIEADIINGHQSVVFDEAENRLHVQKAVLIKLLAGK